MAMELTCLQITISLSIPIFNNCNNLSVTKYSVFR